MARPLEGIKVLEWATWIQGPNAACILADLGAEVIKIEDPVTGDPVRGHSKAHGVPMMLPQGRQAEFETLNRGKKSITLNLKDTTGREVLYRLIKNYDIFMECFPGTAAKLGLDYENLRQHNPKLIYASSSGFGSSGPMQGRPAFDPLAQGYSGIATFLGDSEDPGIAKLSGLADQIGSITFAFAVLVALAARARSGKGQYVETSLLAGMIWLQAFQLQVSCLTNQLLKSKSRSQTGNPLFSYYKCSDGKWLVLGLLESEQYWPEFCRLMGLAYLEKDPKFTDLRKREENAADLIRILDSTFATKPRQEWLEVLKQGKDFLYGPVNVFQDLLSDPQLSANQYLADYEHSILGKIKIIPPPIKFNHNQYQLRGAAPEYGENTEEVLLKDGGYTWEEIAILKQEKVI